MRHFKHLFGPVPSRRLRRSLGVDLTPFKTCNFNCVFCQLGQTTHKTCLRKEYVPTASVIRELDNWIADGGTAEHITLAGSGEPTLHSQFGEVLEFIRTATSIPAVLLTNGSLLHHSEVRRAAANANIVKISLSAWDETSFTHVNRPINNLPFKDIVTGITSFRNDFEAELWIEIFIVWGMNSISRDVQRIERIVRDIDPDLVQLNTAVRPPSENFVQALPQTEMAKLSLLFTPPAQVIAEYRTEPASKTETNEQTILALLQRRPCTEEDLRDALGLHPNEVAKYIGKLNRTGQIHETHNNCITYYTNTETGEETNDNIHCKR